MLAGLQQKLLVKPEPEDIMIRNDNSTPQILCNMRVCIGSTLSLWRSLMLPAILLIRKRNGNQTDELTNRCHFQFPMISFKHLDHESHRELDIQIPLGFESDCYINPVHRDHTPELDNHPTTPSKTTLISHGGFLYSKRSSKSSDYRLFSYPLVSLLLVEETTPTVLYCRGLLSSKMGKNC